MEAKKIELEKKEREEKEREKREQEGMTSLSDVGLALSNLKEGIPFFGGPAPGFFFFFFFLFLLHPFLTLFSRPPWFSWFRS